MSKEKIGAAEALKEKDALFKMGITIEAGERIADHPEAFVAYRFAYKCRECGKEWNKFNVREVEVPQEYAEDEAERTDYDAVQEDDDAREEQYASEE